MTVKRSLLLILLQSLLVFGLGMLVVAPRLSPNPENPFAPSAVLAVFIVVTSLLGAVGLVWWGSVKSVGRTWRELGWHLDDLPLQVVLGVAGTVVCLAMVFGLLAVLGHSPADVWAELQNTSIEQRLMFIVIGINAGFIEESLFRGNLLPALEKRMNGSVALILSAVIFAVFHLNPNPVSLVSKTGFGLVFGVLSKVKRSLVAPAVAHALFWAVIGAV